MIDHVPDEREVMALLGAQLLDVWERLCVTIEERYEMECRWNSGGKAWTYERKYRRGGVCPRPLHRLYGGLWKG